jgi:hypothetical protein
MAGEIGDASKAEAWRAIVSRGRSASLVAFADKGVAVLRQRRIAIQSIEGTRTAGGAQIWDELIQEARAFGLVKFCADGIAVLVW